MNVVPSLCITTLMLGLLGAVVAGCGQEESASAAGLTGCDAKAGMERDRCLHDELRAIPGSQPDEVARNASRINDPMIRGAAVSGWVAEHVDELPVEKGQTLCELLEGRDKSYCHRRLSSPHLQR